MARASEVFWGAFHERWRADRAAEADVARAVLGRLRLRLPDPEARHLEDQLPVELKDLWPAPEVEGPGREAPAARADVERFLTEVRERTGVDDPELATRAAFHALGRVLSADERTHVAAQLPRGLRRLWVEEAGPGSGASG